MLALVLKFIKEFENDIIWLAARYLKDQYPK